MYTFIYNIHALLYNVFVYLRCIKNVRNLHHVIGTVHSDMTVVVLLQKHFLFIPNPFLNSANIIMNCQYATVTKPNISLSNTFFTFFWGSLLCLIYHHYRLSFTSFHLDWAEWCRFSFLTVLQPATRIKPRPSHTETPTRIETRTHDGRGDSIEKSQAPDDGCINVRNMLSIEEVK